MEGLISSLPKLGTHRLCEAGLSSAATVIARSPVVRKCAAFTAATISWVNALAVFAHPIAAAPILFRANYWANPIGTNGKLIIPPAAHSGTTGVGAIIVAVEAIRIIANTAFSRW